MLIAVTTSGTTIDSPFEKRFGRAGAFIIYDTDKRTTMVINNQQNLEAPQGAGIQAAQNVAATGAKVVISGHCGPKAFRVLSAAGIQVYTSDSAATVKDSLELFEQGRLHESLTADVDSHWV